MWFDTVTNYIELTTYTMRHLQQDFTKEDHSTETWWVQIIMTTFLRKSMFTLIILLKNVKFIFIELLICTWIIYRTTECYNFVKNFFSLAVLQHMVSEKESIETKKEVYLNFSEHVSSYIIFINYMNNQHMMWFLGKRICKRLQVRACSYNWKIWLDR